MRDKQVCRGAFFLKDYRKKIINKDKWNGAIGGKNGITEGRVKI